MKNKKDKKKDCLIIGFGRMGQRWHQVLKELKFKNIFIVDKSSNKLKKNNIINKNNIYNNLEECLKFTKPYIAVVSTTADTHKYFAIKLAENNIKKIIVEKPMATSVKDCAEIIKICKKKKIKLAINHQTRFTQEIEVINKIISKFKLGKLISMNVVSGSSGLAMSGIHFIEIFNYLTKNKIFEVSGNFDNKILSNPRGKQFKDNSGQILAKTKSNQLLYLNLSCFQGHGINIIYAFKNGNIVVNRKGLININIRKKKYFNYPMNLFNLPEINQDLKFEENNLIKSTKILVKKFLNNKNFPKGIDGMESVKTIVAAIDSNKSNGQFKKLSKINKSKTYPWA
tara:strand:- start:1735 stop:2757 length:1023 start_codon:yes stop_codon:yes gene_type:complete